MRQCQLIHCFHSSLLYCLRILFPHISLFLIHARTQMKIKQHQRQYRNSEKYKYIRYLNEIVNVSRVKSNGINCTAMLKLPDSSQIQFGEGMIWVTSIYSEFSIESEIFFAVSFGSHEKTKRNNMNKSPWRNLTPMVFWNVRSAAVARCFFFSVGDCVSSWNDERRPEKISFRPESGKTEEATEWEEHYSLHMISSDLLHVAASWFLARFS